MTDFHHQPLFELAADSTPYRKLEATGLLRVEQQGELEILRVEPAALRRLAAEAMRDVSHLFRPTHLQGFAKILEDAEASDNDRFVALELLKNANIAAGMVLPSCQDTGTAIVIAHKGERVITSADDEAALARGIFDTFTGTNLRYSQMAPLTMYDEKNTGSNLPAQIEIGAVPGDEYEFLFITKGGGSANKSFLYQETRAILDPERILAFLEERIRTLGTAACPPYHLVVVIGGLSAEHTMKVVKLSSTHYLDGLPTTGNEYGRAFRDLELEEQVQKMTERTGIGAQFGGKYFCHDVRVVRLPRHGASLPVGIGVSCSADRQIRAKINREGMFLEQLETDPARFLPEIDATAFEGEVVKVALDRPMDEIRAELSTLPVKTRLALTGTLVVARDIAHAKVRERLERGEPMPDYFKNHIIYYAGPAKTPEGMVSGSFGPTTAGRMDAYQAVFMQHGGSLISLAKGNRSKQVSEACREYGGFYLGSIGGPAAILAKNCIRAVSVLDYAELGMEAVFKIEVENFPAFIVVDDKGNDFFAEI